MIERPLFLVGAERSGTTMLRLMLDHHPQIAFSNEFEYAVDLVSEMGWPDLKVFYEHLATNRIFRAHGYRIDRRLGYPELVDDLLAQRRARSGKPIVGATVHRHFDRLLRIWPDAKFIHLVRDGRDVARSCIGMGWAGNVWTGVERWIEAEHVWGRLRRELAADRYVEIRYEDLVRNVAGELGRICALANVDYRAEMLSYVERSTYDRPDPNFSYQWRTKLSEREIRLVEARIGPMLVERGYELSGLPPLNVSRVMARGLWWQDWQARLRYRIHLFGWRLFLEDWVARRVGWRSWKTRVQSSIHQAVRATLK